MEAGTAHGCYEFLITAVNHAVFLSLIFHKQASCVRLDGQYRIFHLLQYLRRGIVMKNCFLSDRENIYLIDRPRIIDVYSLLFANNLLLFGSNLQSFANN